MKKAILLLADGSTYEGRSFGYEGETIGEVCFNTGMTGYQEILTDPSYHSQIVTMTSPHVGNYGINSEDVESSSIRVAGFVVREESTVPSSWRSDGSLGSYLKKNNITGIKSVDTRAITNHIRNNGAMNGIISAIDHNLASLKKKLKHAPNMEGLDLTKVVSCKEVYDWSKNKKAKYNVGVLDFGVKKNILNLLKASGCNVKVFPSGSSAKDILSHSLDGLLLSNGPGDPSAVTYGIKTVGALLGKIPIFGICLGHQLLAIALGGRTYKLKFGHRGINHPVRNEDSGSIEITSQNHGFSVDRHSLPSNVKPTHVNLNDDTLAGIRCKDMKAFSVQYHPESSPGPHDSRYLFEYFKQLMEDAKKR